MVEMKKEDRLTYAVIWTFYGIGGFWLASLILLGFFRDFIVELLPACGWTYSSISSLQCGQSFGSRVLSFYLMFFSPYWALFLPAFAVFILVSHPSLGIFGLLFATFALVLLIPIYIVPFVIATKLFKRLVWRRGNYTPQQRRNAALCLSLIFLPTFCVGLLKLTMEPPWFINRTITVDLWHADLKMERRHLEKWSLVSYPKPDKEPSAFEMSYNRGYKIFPFARLEVPYRELDPSFDDDEKVFIKIEPHYEVRTEAELAEKRQKYFDYESPFWNSIQHPVFKSAGRYMEFDVFEFAGQRSGQPDFYIRRNAEGKIENLLECTPDTHCVTPFGRGWTQKPCADEDACQSCQRICTDKSLGTEMLNIEYRFDKKYLGSYFALHQEVLDFVAAHTQAKP